MKKFLVISLLSLLCFTPSVFAIEKPGEELKEAGLSTTLGAQVDLSLSFTDVNGETKPLSSIVSGTKPILITPVYFDCPRMCGLLLNGATKLLNQMNLVLGEEYEVLTVSFAPEETPKHAKKRQDEYHAKLTRPGSKKEGWHFLVGNEENIRPLMQQIGFKYFKDQGEYAHSAAIIVLTPGGEISQYFTGIEFSPWDTRLSIIEASQGKVGSIIDHFLLYCFRYDHAEGKYTWAVFNLMRVVGLASIVMLLAVVLRASRKAAAT